MSNNPRVSHVRLEYFSLKNQGPLTQIMMERKEKVKQKISDGLTDLNIEPKRVKHEESNTNANHVDEENFGSGNWDEQNIVESDLDGTRVEYSNEEHVDSDDESNACIDSISHASLNNENIDYDIVADLEEITIADPPTEDQTSKEKRPISKHLIGKFFMLVHIINF